MTSAALRDNSGKAPLSFVLQFPTAISAFARVKELGAIKYERDNWKKGGKPDWEYLDAALRHIVAFMSGETFAEDTGCTHLAHAMWNIMALQDLNYPGVVYDKELFDQMSRYWTQRRQVEAHGGTFLSVEEFVAHEKACADADDDIDALGNEIDLHIGPDEEWREATQRRIDSMILGKVAAEMVNGRKDGEGVLDPPVHKVEGKLPPSRDQDVAGFAAQRLVDTKGLEQRAAQDLLDKVLGESKDIRKFEAPQIFEGTVEFAKPMTCRSGDSLVVDMDEGTAKVFDQDGEEINSTTIIGDTEVCNLGSVDLENFLDEGIEEAAEELSRVGGISLGGARDAINQAMNAFTLFSDTDPLQYLMEGNVVTTVEPGELVGKTDRPVEELRAEAQAAIREHTQRKQVGDANLDSLINHPSHRRFIKEKQDEAFRAGYDQARTELMAAMFPETAECGPDCDCGRYELGS